MTRIRFSPLPIFSFLFGLIAITYLLLSFLFGSFFPGGISVINPILLASSLLTLAGLLYAAIKSVKEKWFIHASWMLLVIAYIFDTGANVLKLFFNQSNERDPAYLLIMISYTFISLGIVMLPSSPRPTSFQSRKPLEMLAFTFVILATTWIFLVAPFYFLGSPLFDQSFTALTFVMMFVVFDLLLRRRNCSYQRTSILLCLSIAATVIGEILIAIQRTNSSPWVVVAMNTCWIISYAAIGIAGLSAEFLRQPSAISNPAQTSRTFERGIEYILPALWAGLAFSLMVWSHYHPDILPFEVITAGTGCLIIILVIRLFEAVKENALLIMDAHKEIDSRKVMQEKFWHDSRHDSLTSLPNRSFLVDQIQSAVEMAREKNTITSTLLFLDLDRFKAINDKYGHTVGDQMLKAFSERLIFCVRPDDFVARLAGDEFAILLNNLQSSQTVYKIASRIMDKMKEPFEIEGNMIISGVSFGICFVLPEFSSPEDILKEADKAMYRAKRKGRGRFETSRALEF